MATRTMGFDDYGLSNGEEKQVLEWLQKIHSTEERQVIYDLALDTKASIADDLVYSLVNGISYDKLCVVKNISYSKNDFYGYRRKLIFKIYKHVYKNAHE